MIELGRLKLCRTESGDHQCGVEQFFYYSVRLMFICSLSVKMLRGLMLFLRAG